MTSNSSVIELTSVDAEHVSCHLMPCTIHHDGESQIEKYFLPAVKTNETGLNIVSDDEPDGKRENSTPAMSTWKVKQTFDKFTYWNFDKIPSANDKIQQVMTWLDIAKAINSDPTSATTSPDEMGDKM